MAAPRLTNEQRLKVLTWIAAGYSSGVIREKCEKANIPGITDPALSYYRSRFRDRIKKIAEQRQDEALNMGLALKAERVARLKEYAEEIEDRRLDENNFGTPSWGPEYRATLEDIAKEKGERRPAPSDEEQVIKVYLGIDTDAM